MASESVTHLLMDFLNCAGGGEVRISIDRTMTDSPAVRLSARRQLPNGTITGLNRLVPMEIVELNKSSDEVLRQFLRLTLQSLDW